MEEVAVGGEEEVVEVTIADAEEVGDDAVAGAGADKGFEDRWVDAVGRK